jgi:hypothetical protein
MRATPHPSVLATALFCTATILALGCGGCGRQTVVSAGRDGGGGGTISGLALKGRINGATVNVYRVPGGKRDSTSVGTSTTAADGTFTVSVGIAQGPFIISVTGGTFVDEASGATISLNSDELTYLVPTFATGDQVSKLLITPMSHLAAGLALRYVNLEGQQLQDAAAEAWVHINGHFGNVSWKTTDLAPTDLTTATGSQLDSSAKAGLILAGLSQEALGISKTAGLTGGGAVQALTLVEALYLDVLDGYFDGSGASGPLILPAGGVLSTTPPSATKLDGQTLRFSLAVAMVQFLQSPKRTYSLSPVDVQPMLQAISQNSDSRIFRDPGHAFFNAAPAVTMTAKFAGSDGQLHTPFGINASVSGLVTLTADATGPSGVQSLDVTVGTGALTPAQGNTASHFVGTWDTRTAADGPLLFAAHATDLYGNAGTTPFGLNVDNTAPTITPTVPAPGFYSTSVPLDAMANDPNVNASGLASFVAQGMPGFVATDSAVSHVVGPWALATGAADGGVLADGPAAGAAYFACDAVTNCRLTPILGVKVDRTPPTVAWSGAAPAQPLYMRGNSLSLQVTADDGAGAGVKGVHASIGGAGITSQVDGVRTGNVWTLTASLPSDGTYSILVWAEDLAITATPGGGNKGQNASAPYSLSLTVTVDNVPPSASPTPVAAYYDETNMSANNDGAGAVIAPAQYTFSAGKAVLPADIHKAQTRRYWGPSATSPAPSAVELEGPNTYNTPFLQFAVPYNAATEAPITSAKYCLNTDCGDLILSHSQGGSLYFDLPISANNSSRIAAATSDTVTLSVSLSLADAAGNTSQVPCGNINYNLHGGYIQVTQDTSYDQYSVGDDKSAWYYGYTRQNFVRLWAAVPSPVPSGYELREHRFVLRNPHSEPVLVLLDLGNGPSAATFTNHEVWQDRVFNMAPYRGGGTYTAPDGATLPNSPVWDAFKSGNGCYTGYPCNDSSFNNASADFPLHYSGTSGWQCQLRTTTPVNGTNNDTVRSSGPVHAQVFQTAPGVIPLNEVTFVPTQTGPTRFLVPAASGSTPGTIVVYTTRYPELWPRPYATTDLAAQQGVSGDTNAQYWNADFETRFAGFGCCTFNANSCVYWTATRWTKDLVQPYEVVTGTLKLTTYANPNPAVGDNASWLGTGRLVSNAPLDVIIDHSK